MVAETVQGRVDSDGRLLLLNLHGFTDCRVDVTVRVHQDKRSDRQNRYIHAAATALAEHCGYTLAEMKLVLMGECWGWQTVGGHEMPVKIHTADMTVEEGTYFIDWLVPWATEQFPECGVAYPDERAA